MIQDEHERYNESLRYATEMHKGQYRKGGKEYITHSVAVAEIVREKGGDIDSVISRTIIPASDEIMCFATRDYLPANTFYARLTNGRNRCYDAKGNILAEGTISYQDGNTLEEYFKKKNS